MVKSNNQKCYEKMSALFKEQLDLLYELSRGDYFAGRFQEGWVVLGASCNSAAAMYTLMPQPTIFANEIMMISRSLQEKLINYCYFTVCDEKEAERFVAYPVYRLYHNASRKRVSGPSSITLEYQNIDELSSSKEVRSALLTFADKAGKEGRQNWTKKTFNQRINVIAERTEVSAPLMLMGSIYIYPDASEILHGSLYGVVSLSGLFDAGSSTKSIQDAHESIYSKLILATYLGLELMNETARHIIREYSLEAMPELTKLRAAAIEVLEQKTTSKAV